MIIILVVKNVLVVNLLSRVIVIFGVKLEKLGALYNHHHLGLLDVLGVVCGYGLL